MGTGSRVLSRKVRVHRSMAVRALSVIIGASAVVLSMSAPAMAQGSTITCATVVTTNVTLHADLKCAGDALSVGADGINIDLAGHTVTATERAPESARSGTPD